MPTRAQTLEQICFAPGADRVQNLQQVLDALWRVCDEENRVPRRQFERQYARLCEHFEELASRKYECIRHFYFGRQLAYLTLLKREVPRPQPKPVLKPLETVVVEKPAPPAPRAPRPRCMVFIDTPNLCHFKMEKVNGQSCVPFHPISFFRAQWEMVRKVAESMTHVPIAEQQCFLYTRVLEHDIVKFQRRVAELTKLGIKVVTRDKKDIDSMLMTDMLIEPIRHLREGQEFQIVLISGDGDYAYALKKIRSIGEFLHAKITVHILTWPHLLSEDLVKAADKLCPITHHLDRIDPSGAARLRLYYERRAANA